MAKARRCGRRSTARCRTSDRCRRRPTGMAESVTDLLRQVEVFAGLSEPQLRKIARSLRERRVSQNQVLFREGEIADALYIIISGRVRISIATPSRGGTSLAFLVLGDI